MDHSKQTKDYGTWPSIITKEVVAEKTLRFGGVQSNSKAIYWTESRPHEAGRSAIMELVPGNSPLDILPSQFSAKSYIHEYGGGEYYVHGDDIYFINASDQNIYHLNDKRDIRQLTNIENVRFADMQVIDEYNYLILVTEDHSGISHGKKRPDNDLSIIDLSKDKNENKRTIHSTHDFYAYPRVDNITNRVAWIAWDLPNMPWDSSYLYVGKMNPDGSLSEVEKICDGDGVSVFQPEWGADGKLYFISDENGWANLYAYDGSEITDVYATEKDLGRPLWSLGTRSYCFCPNGEIAVSCFNEGRLEVLTLDPRKTEVKKIDTPLRSFENITCLGKAIYGVGSTDFTASSVLSLSAENGQVFNIQYSSPIEITENDISVGQIKKIPTSNQDHIYGLYYPPTNASYAGQEDRLPPLILMVHGGPTGSADRGVKLKIQYWTNRGFAVFDLDYSGSTGYGRKYKERLDAKWGIREVEDVRDSAEFVVKEGLAEPSKIAISGGSAGGFTVLLALANLDVFAVGSCSYGVADLLHLQSYTHKFEAGYLFRLLGVKPKDKQADFDESVFIKRSPINIANKISSPIVFFQGLDDKIVPPEQTRTIVEKLQLHNPNILSIEFENEGHGFRQAETVKKVLEYEYLFFKKHMKL